MDLGYDQLQQQTRGYLVQLHIADLHFGAMNPKRQYELLMEQFFTPSLQLQKLDVIAVDGDIFDHKVMSNSDTAMYATMFVEKLAELARNKNATLVLLAGTYSHDYDQLKLFYHYLEDPSIDIRIITTIQFEMIKGARVLCIPELYGVEEEIYQKYFFHSDWYDEAFIHGTFQGAVYGDNVGNSRLLTPEDFIYCKGVAISGHVHKSGCFNGFYYYCGCPYRWKFGEEESKGFLVLVHDLDTQIHYVEFKEIKSDRYITLTVDDLTSQDPQVIINYLEKMRYDTGAEFVRIKVTDNHITGNSKTIISQYYRNNKSTFIEFNSGKSNKLDKDNLSEKVQDSYNYVVDDKISDLERFVMFVNDNEGQQFVTVDKLKEILNSDIL